MSEALADEVEQLQEAQAAGADAVAVYLAELDRHHGRNAFFFYADGFLFLFGLAMCFPSTILAGFIHHFSASASVSASLTAIFLLGLSLPQPIGGYLSHRRERRKSLVLGLAIAQKLPILLIASFSLFATDQPQAVVPVMLTLFALFSLLCGMVGPVWADWIGRVLDPRRRGHTLGIRTFWMSMGGLLGALASEHILASGGGPGAYSLLFHIAFISMSLTIPCIYLTSEMDFPRRSPVKPFLGFMKRLWTVLRENRPFLRYVIAMTLSFAPAVVSSVAVWFGDQRFGDASTSHTGAPHWNVDAATGRWNLLMWLAQALFGLAIARVAHRKGPFPALLILMLSSVALPLLALLTPSAAWYSLLFIAMGINQSAFFVAHLGSIYALAPGEERLPYLAVSEILKIPVLTLSVLGGAWLIDRNGGGASIVWVMALSGLAPLIGLAIMPRIPRESAV